MRMSRIFLVCLCLVGLSVSGFSQARPSSTEPGATPTTSPITGTITVTFAITFKSNIPSGDPIACSVTATVSDTVLYSEIAVRAGARNGSHATCVVPIPYSWVLQHPDSDFIELEYSVTTGGTGSSPYPYRESTQVPVPITPVPPSGTVTNLDASFTL